MCVKNLSQLKKAFESGHDFLIIEHFVRPEYTGQTRTITKTQTNAFYSAIKGDPDHKCSKANNGLGVFCEYGKAASWTFTEKYGGIWTATLAGVFEIQVLEKE